ncbi:MAG: hypothetical protein ICV87_05140 [Gemmatimonadetes bacterium]|nr:hypothetical protein [Gemmatimonadota bacterium]
MHRAPRFLAVILLAALFGWAAPSRAQSTGSIGASVDVVYPPLTATGVRHLNFGSLLPGVTREILLPTDITTAPPIEAGEIRITGARNRRGLLVTWTLPDSLRNPNGRGMEISFDGQYAATCEIETNQTCDPLTWNAYNPVQFASGYQDVPERARKNRTRYSLDSFSVYLGGQVRTRADQPPGYYRAPVRVTITAN